MSQQKTPFQVHIMVCQNTRPDQPERVSCGGSLSAKISEELKNFVDELKLKSKVRVSTAKCLGPCVQGPNVMIYPQEIWFSQCNTETITDIKAKIMELTSSSPKA